jgi:hypothetical protein
MSRHLPLLLVLWIATPLAAGDILDNEGLVMLARAGYNERFLAELLDARECRFDTSVEGLVYLAKQGVSERLVRAILVKERGQQTAADERHQAGEATPRGAIETSPARVRLKIVEHKVLVPADPGVRLGVNPTIVVEKGLFGDRYYAITPGPTEPVAVASAGR